MIIVERRASPRSDHGAGWFTTVEASNQNVVYTVWEPGLGGFWAASYRADGKPGGYWRKSSLSEVTETFPQQIREALHSAITERHRMETIEEARRALKFFYQGTASEFEWALFHLIAVSDPTNREKVRQAFPYAVQAWEELSYWEQQSTQAGAVEPI